MKKKSKSMGIEVYILLIVILIAMTLVGSFMLGRRSNNTNIYTGYVFCFLEMDSCLII